MAQNRLRRLPVQHPQQGPVFDPGRQMGPGQQAPIAGSYGYQGRGIDAILSGLGKQYAGGAVNPPEPGGFGLDQGEKANIQPLLRQLAGILQAGRPEGNQFWRGNPQQPLQMSHQGGVLGALSSLGVDTGNWGARGLGLAQDERQGILQALGQLVHGYNQGQGPPNRRGYHGEWIPPPRHQPGPGEIPPYGQLGHDTYRHPPVYPPMFGY